MRLFNCSLKSGFYESLCQSTDYCKKGLYIQVDASNETEGCYVDIFGVPNIFGVDNTYIGVPWFPKLLSFDRTHFNAYWHIQHDIDAECLNVTVHANKGALWTYYSDKGGINVSVPFNVTGYFTFTQSICGGGLVTGDEECDHWIDDYSSWNCIDPALSDGCHCMNGFEPAGYNTCTEI